MTPGIKKYKIFSLSICAVFILMGCGYTTGSVISDRFRTIHVEPFKNEVAYAVEGRRNLYIPLLEVDVEKNIVDRFIFDGNLKIAKKDTADLILKGALTGYAREVLRYEDNEEDAEEYRIRITVSLMLWDVAEQEPVWEEPSFSGEATYFVTGPQAKPEEDAVDDALVDLARRVVERTIENW